MFIKFCEVVSEAKAGFLAFRSLVDFGGLSEPTVGFFIHFKPNARHAVFLCFALHCSPCLMAGSRLKVGSTDVLILDEACPIFFG